MDVREELVLAPGTRLIEAAELRREDRERAGCGPEDVILSRGGARARSKVLPPQGRRVVELFTTPRRIIDAVRILASESGAAASDTLATVFPLLKLLINESLLVEARSAAAEPEPPLPRGARIGSCTVERCIQVYDDTALYQATDGDGRRVALKVARNDLDTTLTLLRREAGFMAEVPSPPAPRLLGASAPEERAWLALEWIEAEPLLQCANRLRRDGRPAELVALAAAMLDAYAALHRAGVLHGDVHPGNVLLQSEGRVRVLDFGYGRSLHANSPFASWKRGGVGFFFEPEYAAASLSGAPLPIATPAGEQYALGVLAYLLLSGHHYLDFSFDESRMYRQILESPAQSFAEAGAASWPAVEAVLARALAKAPEQRYPDVGAFAAALRAAIGTRPDPSSGQGGPVATPGLMEAVARSVSELGLSGTLLTTGLSAAPTGSVHSGASGIAYGLLAIAEARDDPDLLAVARLWSERAMAERASPRAYFSVQDDITPLTVGHAAVAHGAIGTAFVHGLVAGAAGDAESGRIALDLFLAESSRPCDTGDLFLGNAGHLTSATLLLDALAGLEGGPDLAPLTAFGDRLSSGLCEFMAGLPPIGPGCAFSRLGMAHGWAGLLYALIGWNRRRGLPPSADVSGRLAELRHAAVETDHGLRWPILIGGDALAPDQHMHGWCNGGAGHVLLWTLAADSTGERAWIDVARAAAADMVEGSLAGRGTVPFLCCGQVGAAYALLALHASARDPRHLAAAVDMAERAQARIREPALPPTSLFRGALGLAVLAAHLGAPDEALFPVFGLPTGRIGTP